MTKPDLAALLDETQDYLTRHVRFPLPQFQAATAALWAAQTHCFESFETLPFLLVKAPEKRSGKSRLLEALAEIVHEGAYIIEPTAAVLYRLIEQDQPTLLLDEMDAVWKSRDDKKQEIRGILNAGNRKISRVYRNVPHGRNFKVERFRVFCPKAFAGIGNMPDTVEDRSIPIHLQRKRETEPVADFDDDARADAAELRGRLEEWMQSAAEELAYAKPRVPAELNDRAKDGWRGLLAIADHASEQWSKLAREAALELSTDRDPEEQTIGVRLLADCGRIFGHGDIERLFTKDLLTRLHEIDDAPWGDWYGKPLTPRKLADLLRPYGIKSKMVRIGSDHAKGYKWEHVADVWGRYVQPLYNLSESPESLTQHELSTFDSVNVGGNREKKADALLFVDSSSPLENGGEG